MDFDLKCNRLNCRKTLVDKAVVVRKDNRPPLLIPPIHRKIYGLSRRHVSRQ